MAISTAYATLALDDLFQGGTFYCALLVGSAEVTGGSYARVAFTFAAASAGISANAGDIEFPSPSGAWGIVDTVGIYTAASGGTLVGTMDFDNSEPVGIGDRVTIDSGSLTVSLT